MKNFIARQLPPRMQKKEDWGRLISAATIANPIAP
jgi:hypothetical protein